MSIADQFVEQGRKEGRNEGRSEGLREGSRRTLLKLLRTRYGALPQEAVARVEAADLPQLDAWTDRVLTAATLDEALREA